MRCLPAPWLVLAPGGRTQNHRAPAGHLLPVRRARANLLINLPPDNRGLIPQEDRLRLREWRRELERRFAHRIEADVIHDDGGATVVLPETVTFNHLELVEDLGTGERITGHTILANESIVAAGQSVGIKRIHQVDPVTAGSLRIRLEGDAPRLRAAYVYAGDQAAVVP